MSKNTSDPINPNTPTDEEYYDKSLDVEECERAYWEMCDALAATFDRRLGLECAAHGFHVGSDERVQFQVMTAYDVLGLACRALDDGSLWPLHEFTADVEGVLVRDVDCICLQDDVGFPKDLRGTICSVAASEMVEVIFGTPLGDLLHASPIARGLVYAP